MNALYAMSLGKIVLSGADKSFIKSFYNPLSWIPSSNSLNESSKVLLFGTEGATDPIAYNELIEKGSSVG